jgi:hypothetical protein
LGYSDTPDFSFSAATDDFKFFKVTAADGEMPPRRSNLQLQK